MRSAALLVAVSCLALVTACDQLKNGASEAGGDGGTDATTLEAGLGNAPDASGAGATDGGDAGSAADASGGGGGEDGSAGDGSSEGGSEYGPGPYGALPSGYCCTKDDECRNRTCLTDAGSPRCADDCTGGHDGPCTGLVPGLKCAANPGMPGFCMPEDAGASCVPASTFVLGKKPTGACCTPNADAHDGTECRGGRCISFGADTNPYICTSACDRPSDCPAGFDCLSGDTSGICVPIPSIYTCTK